MYFPPQAELWQARDGALASKRWSPGRARGRRSVEALRRWAVEALRTLTPVRGGVMAVAALLLAHRTAAPSPRKAIKGFSRGGEVPLSCRMSLVEAVGRCGAGPLHGAGVKG